MKPFEHIYFPPIPPDVRAKLTLDQNRELAQAHDDLKTVFSTAAGKRVMQRLQAVSHPMDHGPIADPILSAHHHGRAEVVAFLWRHSYVDSPNPEPEKQTT